MLLEADPTITKLSLSSFWRLWTDDEDLSKIMFKEPSMDVCDDCSLYEQNIANMTDEEMTQNGPNRDPHSGDTRKY